MRRWTGRRELHPRGWPPPSVWRVPLRLTRSSPWRLKFRPVDGSFYDLFTEQAQHLVVGAGLLAEMLAEGSDREDVARRMREAEHDADETTHAIVKRVNSTFVTPFDREDIYNLASGLDDVMDMMDEVVDLVLLYEVAELPGGCLDAGRGASSAAPRSPATRCRGCRR